MALFSRALLTKSYPLLVTRSFHASQSVRDKKDDTIARQMFKLNGYYKYGLLHDDLMQETDPDVVEALRRLPEEELMQRTYRAIRASQAEISHSILPKEEWSKFEDNHYYLQPYLREVKEEKREMAEWEANH